MRTKRVLTTAFAVSIAATASAYAGGFTRGNADTDILYEDGNFNMRAGVTVVVPTRKYTANLNPAVIGTDYADTYIIPSAAVKMKITDNLACAGTVAQPYGGSVSVPLLTGGSGPLGKISESFTVTELGATCAAFFNMQKGRVAILGGIFMETFDYSLLAASGALPISLNSEAYGWRAGVAYEIPEIALRAQLLYRSGSNHVATGNAAGGAAPAFGFGNLPQSVELKVQTGVAPGWLVFGSVKWTDWSVNQMLVLQSPVLAGPPFNLPGGLSGNQYFWRDGWTVTGGVGHAFTDNISGALSLTWDRGVATGWDLSSDTWTLGAGASMKDQWGGELRLGAGLSYLTAASETMYGAANSAVSGGWAVAFSGSYGVKW